MTATATMATAPPTQPTPTTKAPLNHNPINDLNSFQSMLEDNRSALSKVITNPTRLDKLIRQAHTIYITLPKLRLCSPHSIIRSLIKAGQLDVDPTGIGGEAWMVPYEDKWMPEGVLNCELLVGYKGRVKVAYREPRVLAIDASVVCEGDHFEFNKGCGHIKHTWELGRPRGKIVGAWAKVMLRGDESGSVTNIEVMGLEELNRVRATSASQQSDAWKFWPEEMHKRAPFNRLFKFLPKTDLTRLIEESDTNIESAQPPTSPQLNGTSAPNTGAVNLASRVAH